MDACKSDWMDEWKLTSSTPPASARPSATMLLFFPVEIQTHIISYLPRRDLASVARTSRHVHAVAIRSLYSHVELCSFDQIEAFFNVTSTLASGSVVAAKHADIKRAQWECIKTLDLNICIDKGRALSIGTLPRSLRGRASEPLSIDRLRMASLNASLILPLLRCFNPVEVCLSKSYGEVDNSIDEWSRLIRWTRLDRVTLTVPYPFGIHKDNQSRSKLSLHSFSRTQTATIVCWYYETTFERALCSQIEDIVRVCSGLKRLDFIAREIDVEDLMGAVKNGIASKQASFFSVKSMPTDSLIDVWGSVEEDT